MKVWQRYLAELFGIYVLVFVGSMSIVAAQQLGGGGATELIAPFGFGLALLGGLYAFAEVSGGHFNPAGALGLFLDRRIGVEDLVGYWISQFVGAILASLTVLLAFNKAAVAGTATLPLGGTKAALVTEIAMTAIFVAVILQSSKSSRYGGSALVAIPLTLLAIHYAAIPFSGASVNPARTLAPALVGHKWDKEWIYFLGPAAGAVIAAIVHTIVVRGDLTLKGQGQGQPAGPTAQ